MELSHGPLDRTADPRNVIRASPLGPLVAALVTFGLLGAGAFAVTRADIPWMFWFVLGPMLLLIGPLFLLVGFAFVGAFRSSLRETNWIAWVRRDGVFLNLRDYRNGHFEGDDPTVVFAAYKDLESVRKVVEVRTEAQRQSRAIVRSTWIELACEREDATAELEIACFLERTREAPETKSLGVRSRTKHHNVAVYVPSPGRVRVAWNRGLFERLSREVKVAPEIKVDLDEAFEPLEVEARALELLRRGERIGAAKVLREAGWEHDAAKDWIDSERERAA